MAYRNIVVDGVSHKYVVGRTHVKIHGSAAVPISKIGARVGKDRWARIWFVRSTNQHWN